MQSIHHLYRDRAFEDGPARAFESLESGGNSLDILSVVQSTTEGALQELKESVLKETGIQALKDEIEGAKQELTTAWRLFLNDAQSEILRSFGLKPSDSPKTDAISTVDSSNPIRTLNTPSIQVPSEHQKAVARVLDVVREANADPDRQGHLTYIHEASQQYGVPESYLMAIIAEESSWKFDAKNDGLDGAVGLGQIIRRTRDSLLKRPELKQMAQGISGDPRLNAKWNVHAMAALIADNAHTLKLDPQNPEDWFLLSVAYHDGTIQAKRVQHGQDLKMVEGYKGFQKRFQINVQDDASYTAFVKRLAEEYSWSAKAVSEALQGEPDREIVELIDLGGDLVSFKEAGFALPKDQVKSGDLPYVTGHFGEQRSDHVHEGIDLANIKEGAPLVANASFKVLRKGFDKGGAGNYVVIEMGGEERKFFHLQKSSGLLTNKNYDAGTVLGYAGNTGHSSGTHLHFERAELGTGKAIDPTPFFAGLPRKGDVLA